MHISRFKVKNFKLFQDVEVVFNPTLSIFTGVNNSGKTTLLQALSLWHECFTKLIRKALRATDNYRRNDYILGTTQDKYFDQINSVLSPNFEDIFYQRDKNNKIELSATLANDNEEITICFKISSSGRNYVIELLDYRSYDFHKLNSFFQNLPSPFSFYYTSPSSAIRQIERFVTPPQIQESIINRDSSRVIRNRLYQLFYNTSDPSLFSSFLEALSFILYNRIQNMNISTVSQMQKDVTVLFNFKHNEIDIEKDIALLGSGSLQIIEILLNLYHPSSIQKDLNLILLDEPDSHIHREIQSRLLKILVQFSQRNQIFITTHNEALIRSANLSNLFHLDGQPTGIYKTIDSNNLIAVNSRFSGIYPSQVNPVISALGMVSGLDFLNAIESDTLIFVEGADDAQVIDILLKQNISNHKKYVYWVLGGVSEVSERILHYKTVFSEVKNNQTLWEKSILIIDRDFLIDTHQSGLINEFQDKINLKSYIWSAYTFESTLFTDIPKLARLLNKWLLKKGANVDVNVLENELQTNYLNYQSILADRYNDQKYEKVAFWYKNLQIKLNTILDNKYMKANDQQLNTNVRQHVNNCFTNKYLFKLMTKDDVETVISAALQPHGISFDVKTEFIELIEQVDISLWFDEWNFLNSI
ncbi:AAA family ATPase [Dolichospermum sp. ST_con]|nr:AAA family ATPase [Dolichospermum sp. ST_con]MDD1423238.1 AAA family ATPase [Dolichospermum sp. ST_sed9]MDD1431772.1 AAA family ATPase [Dolichospermum sp. ST_sed6]MDD1438813.1 AAA family ATPase [Dolichospermum sp. ST_sed3]MDD1444716.1 AAA family ATPase [Dolichospermum sp. ST_sed8]MDD1454876.1 AAA family ATPase [Dolichospermum sp. ST_sed7]MDD1469997.1 AAA family ATPase [Dolichospermum sp. ST_sed4]